MEVDIRDGNQVPAVETGLDLTIVRGGAGIVNLNAAGTMRREVETEAEELVEVALGWKWYYNHCNFMCLFLHCSNYLSTRSVQMP